MALEALRCNHLAPLGFKGLNSQQLFWFCHGWHARCIPTPACIVQY